MGDTKIVNSICPHRLTGLCDNKEVQITCGHSKFHNPKSHGFTCHIGPGVCNSTDLRVICVSVTDERREQLKDLL